MKYDVFVYDWHCSSTSFVGHDHDCICWKLFTLLLLSGATAAQFWVNKTQTVGHYLGTNLGHNYGSFAQHNYGHPDHKQKEWWDMRVRGRAARDGQADQPLSFWSTDTRWSAHSSNAHEQWQITITAHAKVMGQMFLGTYLWI